MRNIIPIIFVAVTVLAGCSSPKQAGNTMAASTTTSALTLVANTNAAANTSGTLIVTSISNAETLAITNVTVTVASTNIEVAVASTNIPVAAPSPAPTPAS